MLLPLHVTCCIFCVPIVGVCLEFTRDYIFTPSVHCYLILPWFLCRPRIANLRAPFVNSFQMLPRRCSTMLPWNTKKWRYLAQSILHVRDHLKLDLVSRRTFELTMVMWPHLILVRGLSKLTSAANLQCERIDEYLALVCNISVITTHKSIGCGKFSCEFWEQRNCLRCCSIRWMRWLCIRYMRLCADERGAVQASDRNWRYTEHKIITLGYGLMYMCEFLRIWI